MSYSNDRCRYRGCDGPDIREWDDVRSGNPSCPETPSLGHIYPHVTKPEEPWSNLNFYQIVEIAETVNRTETPLFFSFSKLEIS